MRRVREYEIWSSPGCFTVDPSVIATEVAKELGFSGEVITLHNQLPDQTDCENLSIGLVEHELSIDDLAEFCSAFGYPFDLNNSTVAYHFLNYSYGKSLAWIHLDEKDDHDAVRARICMTVRRKGLALVDPETLMCLIFD